MKTIHQIIIIIISTLTILAGCTSTPVRQSQIIATADNNPNKVASIDTLLIEAQKTRENFDSNTALLLISELLAKGSLNLAENKLDSIDSATLSLEDWLLYSLLRGSLLKAQKNFGAALNLYTNNEINKAVAKASSTIQWQYGLELAELTAASGDVTESIQLLFSTQALLLDPKQLLELRRVMWVQLILLDQANFKDIQKSISEKSSFEGWIKLANIARNNNISNVQQLHKLNRWTKKWPYHPGLMQAEELINQIQKAIQNKPQTIALMLPLSGELANSGKAVRDGFLAAFFNAKGQQQKLPKLVILDSNRDSYIQSTYDRALKAGAQLIIGPLTKAAVLALIDNPPEKPITTLALNQISGKSSPDWLKQFALSPIEEIKQLVSQGLFHHPGNALVIYPDTSRGKKQKYILENAWTAENNEVVAQIAYTEQKQFSEQIKSALNIDQSEKRAKKLRRLINSDIENSPRRRQDINIIFLLSDRAEDARSLKPLLDFHYAGDLPIYATSTIFEGDISSARDRDINKVKFVDMPWTFESAMEEKKYLQMSPQWQPSNSRLYALGTDAWLIHDRLNILQKHYLRGNTGTLIFDNNGTINRYLTVGIFYRGKPKSITVTTPKKM